MILFILFIIALWIFLYRLEEKIFDMESENQVLRQQTLVAPAKRTSDHLPPMATKVNAC